MQLHYLGVTLFRRKEPCKETSSALDPDWEDEGRTQQHEQCCNTPTCMFHCTLVLDQHNFKQHRGGRQPGRERPRWYGPAVQLHISSTAGHPFPFTPPPDAHPSLFWLAHLHDR